MKKYLTCLLVLIMLLFTGCIKNYKTVTFDSDGGTPVESIKVEKGNTINEPSAPTKEKYEFVGWFLDGEKFNFKKRKDCTIHSIKEVEYFLCNLDKAVKSIKIYKFLK